MAVIAALFGLGLIGAVPSGAAARVTAARPAAAPASSSAYEVVNEAGEVDAEGAQNLGSLPVDIARPAVGIASTPDGEGYDVVASDGGVFCFGDAAFHGSTGNLVLAQPVVGMAIDPATGGYWLVAADGGVFAFDAPFYGSMGGRPLNKPVVGIAATPGGTGYDLVASDGGIFSFGSATFEGSTGNLTLAQPVVGMATDPATGGYWMVAADGGIFAFNAPFEGSLGNVHLAAPITGLTATADGAGYDLVGADGGVFSFGDAPFLGSAAGSGASEPFVGIASAAALPPPPVRTPALTIGPNPLTPGDVGQPFPPVQLTASGGTAPYTWTATALPPGLGLSSSGVLSGTPTTSGEFSAKVEITESGATVPDTEYVGIDVDSGDAFAYQSPFVDGDLGGVSCPAEGSTCTAVGQNFGTQGLIARGSGTVGSWATGTQPSILDAVSCFDDLHCTAVGGEMAAWTTDGGQTWTYAPTGESLDSISCPSAADCFAASGGTVVTTSDAGATWSKLSVPAYTSGLGSISCPTTDTCYATGGTTVIATADGGSTWTTQTLPTGTKVAVSVSCATPMDCLATAIGNVSILTTDDGGQDWIADTTAPGGFFWSISCTSDGACGAAGSTSYGSGTGLVISTPDSGSTWTTPQLPAFQRELRFISCTTDDGCTVVGGPDILRGPVS